VRAVVPFTRVVAMEQLPQLPFWRRGASQDRRVTIPTLHSEAEKTTASFSAKDGRTAEPAKAIINVLSSVECSMAMLKSRTNKPLSQAVPFLSFP
jgi:hypothetical protein